MFYDNFIKACNSIGKTPSAVLLEIGLGKSAGPRGKRGEMPTDATLRKLADYFGVSPEELTWSIAPAPIKSPVGNAHPDHIVKYNQLTPEGQKEVLAFIEFKQAQEATIAARGGKVVKKPSPVSAETKKRER